MRKQKKKTDFKPYKVGTVFNPIASNISGLKPIHQKVVIKYPSRLNAMAIDPSKIAANQNLVYTPGEVVFSVKIYKKIEVRISGTKQLRLSERTQRKSLVRHAFLLMRKALCFQGGFWIDIDNRNEIRHAGLGSSGSLIAGVAAAINELYGKPIDKRLLVRYLAQNHGEEIEGDKEMINPVQCIGGSAASGIFGGGMLLLAGESCVIKTMKIDESYSVIIGIPKDFVPPDSKKALEQELENIEGFIKCGRKYGPQIAYNVFHRMLPAMVEGNLKVIGDVIYDYRFNMGSIKNCSFLYPKLPELTQRLAYLKHQGVADVLAISSVGPGIFAITKKPSTCLKAFKKADLNTFVTTIENSGYRVLQREKFNAKTIKRR